MADRPRRRRPLSDTEGASDGTADTAGAPPVRRQPRNRDVVITVDDQHMANANVADVDGGVNFADEFRNNLDDAEARHNPDSDMSTEDEESVDDPAEFQRILDEYAAEMRAGHLGQPERVVSPSAAGSSDMFFPSTSRHHCHDDDSRSMVSGMTDDYEAHIRRVKNEKRRKRFNFDLKLPTNHAYLGDDFHSVSTNTFYEEGEVIANMPLFPVPHLILMPGQILPLNSLYEVAVNWFRKIVQQRKQFAVICFTHRPDDDGPELASIGTIAHIIAFKEDSDDNCPSLKMRAIGKERFTLLSTNRQIDGTLTANIRIMYEHPLPPVLRSWEPQSFRRNRSPPRNQRPLERRESSNHRLNRPTTSHVTRYSSSALSRVPWFVVKQNDVDTIIDQLVHDLKEWAPFDEEHLHKLAQNPTQFSYWVAMNLPLDDRKRLEMLGMECTMQRLRAELQLLTRCTHLVCKQCDMRIGDKASIVSMSLEGPMCTFVNAGGHVHEMFTLMEVNNHGVQCIGDPSMENSWFPGYSWTIVYCERCRQHIGWRFSANNASLHPRNFWGITRTGIQPSLTEPSAVEC